MKHFHGKRYIKSRKSVMIGRDKKSMKKIVRFMRVRFPEMLDNMTRALKILSSPPVNLLSVIGIAEAFGGNERATSERVSINDN